MPASRCRCCPTAAPAPTSRPAPDGIALAKGVNDYLAEAVTKHPKRLAGFAALPMASPDACAAELSAR